MPAQMAPTALATMVGHVIEGRAFALASFMLFFWDYCITLDKEVQHFWSGPWSISRVLFFCNRYFTLGLLIFRLLVDFYPCLFPSIFCDVALRVNFPLNLAAMAIIQGILVLRMWYLFTSSKVMRYTLLLGFIWCTAGSIACLGMQFGELHSSLVNMPHQQLSYCSDPPPSQFYLVFIPAFVMHALLSIAMVIRIVHNVRTLKHLPFLKRCVSDGGFLYMLVFFSVSFSISGAIVGVSPSAGIVAMFSNFMLALLSTCLSRVILNLCTLSQAYTADPVSVSKAPALLLHTAMVDRVTWERKMGCIVFTPAAHHHGILEYGYGYGKGYEDDEDDDLEEYL